MTSSAPYANFAARFHGPAKTGGQDGPPLPLLIVSTVLYAVFSFVVTIVAMATFWPAGVLLALVLGWRGGFIPQFGLGQEAERAAHAVRPDAAEMPKSSGNASFDAYRADMLNRLQQEQDKFEGFLDRLRAAKDQSEFDTFMDERAKRARLTSD